MDQKTSLTGFLKSLLQRTPDQNGRIPQDDRVFLEKKHHCPACHIRIDEIELERTLFVCPGCQHHFRINPFERIRFFADGGVFQEFGESIRSMNPLEFPGYEEKIEAARSSAGMEEAVMTGTCRLGGREAVVAIMAFQFMGGSMGSAVGEKISRALVLAAERRLPAIIFVTSGGARMQEGIFSLMQMAKTAGAVAACSERGVPVFIVLTDPTYGGVTASFAMLGNVILAEPGALIGFAGPRVIEGTIKQKLPEGFQRAEFQLQKGFVDAIVERKDLKATLGFLIDTHQPAGRIRR